MTRERLIEILKRQLFEDEMADAILAEMAGEWNAAIEAAKRAALSARYGAPSNWKADNPEGWHLTDPCSPRDASMHDNGTVDAAKAIMALRRPDAAPAPKSGWQFGDPRCDNCDNGQEKEWVFCPFCGHQTKFEDDYGPESAPARPVEPVTRETVEAWLAYFDAHADEFAASHADLIARLTRPAAPSVEEVARAIDPLAMSNRSQRATWAVRRKTALERASAVLALFAKERS